MDVFLTIRRQKSTIFTDAKETTSVAELKKIIHGITKVEPSDQRLYKDDNVMEDNRSLGDYQLNSTSAKSQSPAMIALVCKKPDGEFEAIDITPLSVPPDLPDVMKQQEHQPHAEQAPA